MKEACRLGTDSHAGMSCVGRHTSIVEIIEGQRCTVYPFNDTYSPMEEIHTVNAAFAHDTNDGRMFVLHVNNALDFTSSVKSSILCTNQARSNGIIVDDAPNMVDVKESSTHSIVFPNEEINLPLSIHGPVSYLPVRYPSNEHTENEQHLHLTDGDVVWDPDILSEVKNVATYFTQQTNNDFSDGDNNLSHTENDIHSENYCHKLGSGS